MRSTPRWADRLLVVLTAMAVTATMAAPAFASVAASTAQTTSVLTTQERADLPAGARKVTRAGLVHGTIPAQVGDIVLAATVLHASQTFETDVDGPGPGGAEVNLRSQSAIEEDTSNRVRGFWRFRLVYGPNDTTWSTYHQGVSLRVHRKDYAPNQADGCLASPPNHCTWTTDPSDCRGPNPTCDVYQRTGLYRAKGDAADWWLTEFKEYRFWHPGQNSWKLIFTCSTLDFWSQGLWWRVGGGTSVPDTCPYPEGV
jgi:hypothetical protein